MTAWDDIRLIRLPRGELVAFRPDDSRSVDLLARLHRSGRGAVRLGLGVLKRSAIAGRVLSAACFNSEGTQSGAEELLCAVRTLLDEEFDSVAFNIAPDLSRATIALLETSGRTIFVKARSVDDTRLDDMAAFLREFRDQCPSRVVVPELLRAGTVGRWSMVALSDVGSDRPTGDAPALGELIPYLHALRAVSGEPDPADPYCLSLAHGDFVPWNMWLRSDRLHLWDWDKTIGRAPWPYDAIHYAFQTRRCLRGMSRVDALSGAMAEIELHAAALRVPGFDDDARRQFALYGAHRLVAERRLERVSADGEWLAATAAAPLTQA